VQGVAAFSVMVTDSAYVEANFKETELKDMRVGQRAEVQLDAFPDHVLPGRVESIGVGTGSEFSVLPAQNATGNWVKVVQRVPVRIKLDGKPPVPLIAGLSAEVKVITK
jgi:membrane fusion protein, multidrug efflux system